MTIQLNRIDAIRAVSMGWGDVCEFDLSYNPPLPRKLTPLHRPCGTGKHRRCSAGGGVHVRQCLFAPSASLHEPFPSRARMRRGATLDTFVPEWGRVYEKRRCARPAGVPKPRIRARRRPHRGRQHHHRRQRRPHRCCRRNPARSRSCGPASASCPSPSRRWPLPQAHGG